MTIKCETCGDIENCICTVSYKEFLEMEKQIHELREEIEYLKDVLRQVTVDINDPHPRTSTLEGFRKCMFSTEEMIVRVLNGEKVDVM